MSDRKQDYSWHFGFGDDYNLRTGSTEEDAFYHNLTENTGPKVLTTMRNMFSERKTDEYELVYDVPGQRQQEYRPYYSPPTPLPPPQPFIPAQRRIEEEEDHEEEDHEEDESFEDNRIVHQCPECNKKYTSERRLKHHIQVHKNADAYKCPKCGYCYQSPDSLRRHWKKTPNCDEALAKSMKTECGES